MLDWQSSFKPGELAKLYDYANSPLPDHAIAAKARLADAPDRDPNANFLWGAWFDLSTDRPPGEAINPIPFAAITNYANEYGFTGEWRERFIRAVRHVDDHFTLMANTKRREEMDRAATKKKGER